MDDDVESARSIILNLKNEFNIDHYLSAKKVLKAIGGGKVYELLLLDYDMAADGTGIEVLAEIKKNIYYIPAIMISAVVYSDTQVQEAMNAGFAKYFAKHDPHLITKLRGAIIELVAQSLDPVSALEKWIRSKPGREGEHVSLGSRSCTIGYILDKLKKNKDIEANQRMILVRCMLDYLVAESTVSGDGYT